MTGKPSGSWLAAVLWIGVLLLPTGCGDEEGDGDGTPGGSAGTGGTAGSGGSGNAGGSEPWVWVELLMSLPDGPAIDPKLDGDPSLRVSITAAEQLPTSCSVTVEALEPGGRVALVADALAWVDGGIEVAWNGRDEADVPFDPGPVQLAADLYCTERMQGFGETRAYVLRLGVVAVDLDGDTVPLAYHKLDLHEKAFTLLGGTIHEYLSNRTWALELADLDHDDGSPRAPVPPWPDPCVPPWGHGSPGTVGLGSHNVPVAHVAGGDVTLSATLGTTAVSVDSGLAIPANGPQLLAGDAPEIRVVLAGYDAVGDATWEPGATVAFDSATSLPDTVGRTDVELSWGFEVFVEGQWLPVPGELRTTHRVYRVVGPSMVPDGTHLATSPLGAASPAVAWVGALEDTAPTVDGIAASDQNAIMTALRHHIYNDPWVEYFGGSAYDVWIAPWYYPQLPQGIDLGGWLDRSEGVGIECLATACLLASLSNHLGIDGRYVWVEGDEGGFDTRMARAAGTTEWSDFGFGFHLVTRLGSTGLVWDCALDFDGDADPDSPPCTPLSPVEVPEDDYLTMLTRDPVYYDKSSHCYAW